MMAAPPTAESLAARVFAEGDLLTPLCPHEPVAMCKEESIPQTQSPLARTLSPSPALGFATDCPRFARRRPSSSEHPLRPVAGGPEVGLPPPGRTCRQLFPKDPVPAAQRHLEKDLVPGAPRPLGASPPGLPMGGAGGCSVSFHFSFLPQNPDSKESLWFNSNTTGVSPTPSARTSCRRPWSLLSLSVHSVVPATPTPVFLL